MSISIRTANQGEARIIRHIVRQARINPFDLDWPNFVVAEHGDQIAGVGQVKTHRDGSRELASIAVRPEYQGQGIGSQIIWELIDREKGLLYLTCTDNLEGFYRRFGFRKVNGSDLSPSLARAVRFGNTFAPIMSFLSRRSIRIIAMRRDPS